MSAMHEIHLKDLKRAKDFKLMLGLNKTIDQLAMEDIGNWHDHELNEDGRVLNRALESKDEGQRKKGMSKMTWKGHVEGEC